MADSVLNLLLQRLSQPLVEEANCFCGVEDQVKSLHGELMLMNIFLKNFEGKRRGHETVAYNYSVDRIGHDLFLDRIGHDLFLDRIGHDLFRQNVGVNSKGKRSAHEMEQKRSAHEMEQKRIAHEMEQKRSAHEMEQKRSAHEMKQKRSAHEMKQKRIAHEMEQKRSAHEMEQERIAHEMEQKRSAHEMLEDVIRKIVVVAYEAEDVIDTIIFNVATHTDKPGKINHATEVRVLLHDVAKKIEGLKQEINKNFKTLEEVESIETDEASEDAATEALRKHWREVEEVDVVSYDYSSKTVLKQLTKGNPHLLVVSTFGEGGSGKTTFARQIYNNVDIKSHFNWRAWVSISQNFSTREVLVEILKSEMPKSDELTRKKLFKDLSEDELKKKLFKCLQGKRYLVVLDQIWTTKFWDEVSSAFPDESSGSRILLTTKAGIFLHASNITTSYLPPLTIDESWELFSKKVFPGGSCPTDLETLGRQILESCKGLPLSVVVLAGILANKEKKYETWVNFNGRVYGCPKLILELCYFQLPRNLKPCLLYFGVFPKGFEIPVRLLIKLWVAEGFIQHPCNIDPEDVAEDYLEKLIDRGLVQVASRRTDGGAKTCRIHDFVQDLCIQRSLIDKFLEVLLSSASTSTTSHRAFLQVPIGPDSSALTSTTSRRVSFQGPNEPCNIHKYTPDTTCVRSLFFFKRATYGLGPKQWKWVYENFKLGRVLNLGQVDLYSIPTVITKLIHLRYLSIESDVLKAIPSSIGKLINLETLNMKGTFLNCLPKEIWKLRRLRNLYVSGPVSLPNDLDPDDGTPSKLQVLSTVFPKPQSSLMMTNVRNLGLWFASDESNSEVVEVLKSLHHLHHLQTLKIINCCEYRCLSMSLPSTLTKITLRLVRLKVRRDMRMLGELPNLQILKLQSCLLSKLHVFAGSFPQLQVLKLENLKIKKWKQRRGAMPCLKHLVIKQCSELTMLPLNRLSLTALRDVQVLWSNSVSAKMLQELQVTFGFNLLIYPPMIDDLH